MKKNLLLMATLGVLCLHGTPASAQTQAPRGYVAGIGGLTFGTESDGLFAGEFAVDVTPVISIYGTGGRMLNIAPKYVNDALDEANALLTLETGQLWEFKAKAPTMFAVGGVKVHVPTRGRVRPYGVGGVGFGSIHGKVTEARLGDITDELINEGWIDQKDMKTTKFLFEAGGGVEVGVGALYIDAGYRFGKFTGIDDANVSRAYGGVGVRF